MAVPRRIEELAWQALAPIPDADRKRVLEALRNPPPDIRQHDMLMRAYYGDAGPPAKPCRGLGLPCRICDRSLLPRCVDASAPWRVA